MFSARGEKGGERLVTYAAGSDLGLGDVTFAASKDLMLTAEWQRYEMDLENADLSRVTHAFAFEILKGNEGEKQVAYIDSIYFIENDDPGSVPQQ